MQRFWSLAKRKMVSLELSWEADFPFEHSRISLIKADLYQKKLFMHLFF